MDRNLVSTKHVFRDHEWLIEIEWTRLPVGVSIRSLEDPPRAVTRGLIDSVRWSDVIWNSRPNRPLSPR